MTGTRGRGTRIPNGHVKTGLRGQLDTARTVSTEGPVIRTGTSNIEVQSLRYEDLPPPKVQSEPAQEKWSLEKFGAYLGIGIAILSIILFFYRMDSNVDAIKTEVKDSSVKLDKLNEKTNKQQSNIENLTSSVQRLESEIRRTQDYVQDNKK